MVIFTLDLANTVAYHEGMVTRASPEDQGNYRGQVPPPIELPSRSDRQLIDKPSDLAAASRVLLASPILAIDVEFVSARSTDATSVPRLALIQIADAQRCFVVDALRINNLSALAAPFENPDIIKVFHGVGSDLRVMALRDIVVEHVIDLEAASRSIFGSRESGLQAMMQRACNIRMDKTLQRSDWTQRPLTNAMFAYAARDAEMTLTLYVWLSEHYRWALDLYEDHPDDQPLDELVTPWLLTFIQGDRTFPPDFIDEAAGSPRQDELTRDCIDALAHVQRPVWRARILRAAADLALTEIAPSILDSLHAISSEERSAAVRALGRLRAADTRTAIEALLDDPVFDVRRSAASAIEQLDLPPRVGRFARNEGGAVEISPEVLEEIPDDTPWKTMLRGLIPKDTEDAT